MTDQENTIVFTLDDDGSSNFNEKIGGVDVWIFDADGVLVPSKEYEKGKL